jgi:hypothetical protein
VRRFVDAAGHLLEYVHVLTFAGKAVRAMRGFCPAGCGVPLVEGEREVP